MSYAALVMYFLNIQYLKSRGPLGPDFAPFGRSGGVTHASRPPNRQKFQMFFRKYQSQVVRNTVRSLAQIQLKIFEKYIERRSDPYFL